MTTRPLNRSIQTRGKQATMEMPNSVFCLIWAVNTAGVLCSNWSDLKNDEVLSRGSIIISCRAGLARLISLSWVCCPRGIHSFNLWRNHQYNHHTIFAIWSYWYSFLSATCCMPDRTFKKSCINVIFFAPLSLTSVLYTSYFICIYCIYIFC